MKNNIRDVLLNDQTSVQQILGQTDEQKFDDHWTGKVIDNEDPLHMGRVKIRILGYYNEISDAAIPWALPEATYLGSTKGTLIIPEVNTVVRGYFDKGDDQKPIYTAIAPSIDNYATSQMLENPEEALDYPNVMVLLHTDEGERVTLNRSNGEISVSHRSGTKIVIAPNGAITIETSIPVTKPGASVSTDPPGATINLAGNYKLTSKFGNIDIESTKGTININSKFGDINIGKNAADVDDGSGNKIPSPTKRKVNNFSNCLYTGAPHCDPIALPNVNVYV